MAKVFGILSALLYVGSIIAANYALNEWGTVPVGFGLLAPAGVAFAAVSLTFRDFTQDTLGKLAVFAVILIGTAVSWYISPAFAMASGTAFLVSELADFAVYTPLRSRNWLAAIAVSNTVGLIADSVLFLWLAFGNLDFLYGLILGKLYATALAVVLIAGVRYIHSTPEAEAWS